MTCLRLSGPTAWFSCASIIRRREDRTCLQSPPILLLAEENSNAPAKMVAAVGLDELAVDQHDNGHSTCRPCMPLHQGVCKFYWSGGACIFFVLSAMPDVCQHVVPTPRKETTISHGTSCAGCASCPPSLNPAIPLTISIILPLADPHSGRPRQPDGVRESLPVRDHLRVLASARG